MPALSLIPARLAVPSGTGTQFPIVPGGIVITSLRNGGPMVKKDMA
jgi:hypothetical protein